MTSFDISKPMTNEEIERAALADSDALPLTAQDFARMKRTPQVVIRRRALNFKSRCLKQDGSDV